MCHLLKEKILLSLKTLAMSYSGKCVFIVPGHILSNIVCLGSFAALGVEIPIQVTYSEGVWVEKLEMNITDRG